jgi:hypothetical protein
MEQLKVPFSWGALLVSALYCYVLNKSIRYYTTAHQRRQNARQLDCKAAPLYPHLDPILGLDTFYSSMRAVARGHVLDEFEGRFKKTCGGVDTFEIKAFDTKEIHTMEPENVKTVLSLKPKDYQHYAARKGAFSCFGPGILASDILAGRSCMVRSRRNHPQTCKISSSLLVFGFDRWHIVLGCFWGQEQR